MPNRIFTCAESNRMHHLHGNLGWNYTQIAKDIGRCSPKQVSNHLCDSLPVNRPKVYRATARMDLDFRGDEV